jgi:hypothetical protein
MKYSIRKDGITQSMMGEVMLCPARLSFITNLWSPKGIYKNTAFGTLFHSLIDEMVKAKWKLSKEKLDILITNHSFHKTIDCEYAEYMRAVASVLAPLYIQFYKDDAKLCKEETPEMEFDLIFEGFRLKGKVDSIYKVGKNVYVFRETKTKSRIEDDSIELQLHDDWQTMFYANALHAIGKSPAYMIYDIIRFPQRKAGDLHAFCIDLKKDILKRPEYFFQRIQVDITEEQILLFRKELLLKLRYVEDIADGKFPIWKNQCACFGTFKCGFAEACKKGDFSCMVKKKKLFEELHK